MIAAVVVIAALAVTTGKPPTPGQGAAAKGAVTKGASTKARGAPVVEVLQDGTTLVFLRTPGERKVALRYVVRSGGEADPPGKAGLAHILEHLIFHGTYEEPEGVLFESAWAAGANLNAFTGPDWTTYVLDAPPASFPALASSLLSTVTSPALPFSSFDREKGVVEAEDGDRPDIMTITYALDQLIFPSHNGGLTVIGTPESRAGITIDDIQDFYALHYVPQNSVLIVAGDITLDDVKAAAERGLRGPPQVEGPPPPDVAEPNLPSEAKGGSWLTVTAHGHLVDGASRGACEAAAGLVELRLRRRVLAVEHLSAGVFAQCARQRGHDLIVMAVVTSSPESSQLPNWISEVYADAARAPATAAERGVVEARRRAAIASAHAGPAAFAEAVVWELARPDLDAAAAVREVFTPPVLQWSSVPQTLAAGLPPSRVARLHFSRFEH